LFENGRRDAVFYPDFTNKSAKRDPFRDGDTAWVSFGREQSRSTVHASGNVRFPGSYPWVSGNTAADLLQTAGGLDDSAYEARIIVLRRDTLGQLWSLRSSAANATSISLIPGDSLRVFNRLLMSDSDSVRISGAVREPGRFPYRRGMTLKDLILLAGGFLPDAEFGKVRLEQSSKDSLGATTRYLALDSSLKADAADQLLEPNQHLAIPYNPRWHKPEEVMIQGWVVRPGLYLLKHPGERLSSVIERAGGLKDGGYAHAAIFTRGRDSVGRVRINLPQALSKPGSKFDIAMRGDDTLRIPDRPATVRVSGWVNYPTAVMYEKGRSWKWYVAQAGGFSDSANTKGVWVRYADGSILSRDYGLDDPDAGAEIVVPKAPPKRELTATEQVQIWSGIVGIAMTVATLVVLVTKN
jgi:protein involved in polysaccharide export with SLBB domain